MILQYHRKPTRSVSDNTLHQQLDVEPSNLLTIPKMDFTRGLPIEVVRLIIEAMVDAVGLRNSIKLRLVNRMCPPGFYVQTSNETRFCFRVKSTVF